MIPLARISASDIEIEEVSSVLRSGQWASGQVVRDFEAAFADYSGLQHAIAVSNGTVALQVALQSLGIGQGSFVITTPFTFIATSATIVSAGAIPVFVDIDPRTFLVDLNQVEYALKRFHPAAVCVVHLFGQSLDGDSLRSLVERYGIPLLEDCAQAQGAQWKGTHVGGFGHVGTHSFYATKNLPTGEGGMVVTNSEEIAAKARRLINHGRTGGYEHIEIGYNYRMTNITAAIGKSQLAQLHSNNLRRRSIAARFHAGIQHSKISLPFATENALHVYHQYTVRTQERDALKSHLERSGIGSAVVYPKTSYQQLAFENVPHVNMGCGEAEAACRAVLSIPVHPHLTDLEVEQIIAACNSFSNDETA